MTNSINLLIANSHSCKCWAMKIKKSWKKLEIRYINMKNKWMSISTNCYKLLSKLKLCILRNSKKHRSFRNLPNS